VFECAGNFLLLRALITKVVFKKLPDQSKWDYTIKLIPNTTLKNCKIYLLNVKEQEKLDKFLKEHLKSGRIRLSKSPCTASFFFVKKRMTCYNQYKTINDLTKQ